MRSSAVLFKISKRCISRFSRPKASQMNPQKFSWFLVLDFEATCDTPTQISPMEIIEFPVLKVNGKTFEVESVFHTYVKPQINQELTPFCVKLTGILQETVDEGVDFKTALEMFDNWMRKECLLNESSDLYQQTFAFVTFGNWDLGKMLKDQCKLCNVGVPLYMKSWINFKQSFMDTKHYWPNSLRRTLDALEIPVVGRIHSGIDDCKNIVAAMKRLAQLGHVFKITTETRSCRR